MHNGILAMIWNNVRSEIHEREANIDDLVNKWSSGCMELMLQDLVGFGKSYHSFDMHPLGSYDTILNDRLSWKLIDPSHGCWCVDLNILGGEQVLHLKEVIFVLVFHVEVMNAVLKELHAPRPHRSANKHFQKRRNEDH